MAKRSLLTGRLFGWLLLLLGIGNTVAGQTATGFVSRTFRDARGEHRYTVFVPPSYSTDKPWPVILFLHTASERGNDGQKPIQVGLAPAIRQRATAFPFLVVFPQCEDTEASVKEAWGPEAEDGRRALAILAEVERTYRVDPERVYLTGASMGGYGTWALAAAHPDRWAAIVPLCGGGNPATAGTLRRLPTWAFHGADDRAVLPEQSREMIDAIRQAGGTPRYDEIPGVGHDVWNSAYGRDDLYSWLLLQKRGQPSAAPTDVSSPVALLPAEAPFVPALHIPNAAYARLGNQMLAAIGQTLPETAPKDLLAGTLPDQSTQESSLFGTVFATFNGIRFRGKLSPCDIRARADGQLAMTLRARDVTLMIDQTSVQGPFLFANCGPIQIRLGVRENLRLRCVVRPTVDNKRLKLKLSDAQFQLSPDNMDVQGPEWVSGGGLALLGGTGMVSSNLQAGFYRETERLERQVLDELPRVLDRLSDALPLESLPQFIGAVWPLPVYKPRVQVWPAGVQVDRDGISLGIGLSVGAVTQQQARATPPEFVLPDADFQAASTEDGLRFAVAPAIFEYLSHPLIDADVARVLVVDTPMKELLPLARAADLAAMAPDLAKRQIKIVRSELIVRTPMRIDRLAHDGQERIELQVRDVFCVVSIPDGQGGWRPHLQIRFDLRQQAGAELRKPTLAKRWLALNWAGEPEIRSAATFVEGVTPLDPKIDQERIRQILLNAWNEWMAKSSFSQGRIGDLKVGSNRFRLEAAQLDRAYLVATFAPAGISLLNSTEGRIAYETKTPLTSWGGPYELLATKEHRYAVDYPFVIRFKQGDKEQRFTLSPGNRFQFRPLENGQFDLIQMPDAPTTAGATSP